MATQNWNHKNSLAWQLAFSVLILITTSGLPAPGKASIITSLRASTRLVPLALMLGQGWLVWQLVSLLAPFASMLLATEWLV